MWTYKTRILPQLSILFMLCMAWMSLSAQKYEVKGYLGATYYQGDLAPLPIAASFAEGNASWALAAGYHINDIFSIYGRFTIGKLQADDANASSEGRKVRNLSFQSPLREYGIVTEVNLNHWLKGLDKYGINIYYTTGLSLFTFDPQAIYQGEVYRLQPLGTEGQGIEGFPERYSLTQLSIPMGLGLSFNISKRMKMGIEVSPRKTFTDYLDDVSGSYVSAATLLENQGQVAVNLANRTGEYLAGPHIDYDTGALRGDASDDDWYFFVGVSLSYAIGPAVDAVVPPAEELISLPATDTESDKSEE